MKVRLDNKTLSKTQLEEVIHKAAEKEMLELCRKVMLYAIKTTVAECCLILHERHWHKDKIQQFFNDMVALYKRPAFMGREISDEYIMKFIAQKYELNFDDLEPIIRDYPKGL